MKIPSSTYRIQFNKDFTFQNFEKIKVYLKDLGVQTIYASPIFEAVTGSDHGYDVCNPNKLNPEIGNLEELLGISNWLKTNEMFWLQDIVPNHMAFHPQNPWLMDVLEKGQKSVYKHYFDAAFTCPAMDGKLMVPFLGESLADAIAAADIILKWNGERLLLCYQQMAYPVNPATYIIFLEKLKLESLAQEVSMLEGIAQSEYAAAWFRILNKITEAIAVGQKGFELEQLLSAFNENKQLLKQIASAQYYELCFWQETNQRINYRRFFTVNGLISLKMENEAVFEEHHRFVKNMLDQQVFDGLRVDHVDGLFEPSSYLNRLRNLAGKETYLVVEKILEDGEEVPKSWPVQGTTGYDFLGILNNLFTKASSEKQFSRFYQQLSKAPALPTEELSKKELILESYFSGDLDNLVSYFTCLNLVNQVVDEQNLRSAIAALLTNMQVYRFYSESFPLNNAEQSALASVFNQIKAKDNVFGEELELLRQLFLEIPNAASCIQNNAIAAFFKRCMQFSGPIMAKAVEDTLMYTNFRFTAHNEVGDHPKMFGIQVSRFHKLMVKRQKESPFTINTSATHDTKRGEGARARLNALTATPLLFFNEIEKWQKLNFKVCSQLKIAPAAEYFIYQCLLAHYPFEEEAKTHFSKRFKNYLQKAFREGKQHSDWANVNADFEHSVASFVDYLLDAESPFWQKFMPYQQKIALHGVYNSLAQLCLKFTCPGVPDVYQGGELWDFSFVDPDNRTKVDYELRIDLLKKSRLASITALMENYQSGAVKLWLTHQLLKLRNSYAHLFTFGSYIPVTVKGKYHQNIVAFIRKVQHKALLCITVVNGGEIMEQQQLPFKDLNWEDTAVVLPDFFEWFNLIQKNSGKGKEILLNDLTLALPLALCTLTEKNSRGAGILMHISSLPSNMGMGDLGAEAFKFADFLSRSAQHYWQVLPIGPGASEYDISPYSTLCSMAGNPLFISLDMLVEQGLLRFEQLKKFHQKESNKVDFSHVKIAKNQLLKNAFLNYLDTTVQDQQFHQFIKRQNYWLHDYALFMVLKASFGKSWFMWPREYKFRDKATLDKFEAEYEEQILEQKWYQYLFEKQWNKLKRYCNAKNIHLIGDLPFYINHDSADVWANPHFFSLLQDGAIYKMAGVPPDYFSADGQLWGMPVYNWEALQKDGFKWWLNRIAKNLEWFNLLRLDHFRAFYNFWEVDASESTAVNGKWNFAPGAELLQLLSKSFPEMPFIAEDLGDVQQEVFKLRDKFSLPGMKVLQFAFGEDMPVSPHILHHHSPNFIVYTGTHDNNTTRGWYNQDLSSADKTRLNQYFSQVVSEEQIAALLIKAAYASVAKIAIIPIQDLLNLGGNCRTNIPGTAKDNWSFKILFNSCNSELASQLRHSVTLYARNA